MIPGVPPPSELSEPRPAYTNAILVSVVLASAVALFSLRATTRHGDPVPRASGAMERAAQLRVATSDEEGFELLPPPAPGEWLSVHPEPPQSFYDFRRFAPPLPTSGRATLVFLPLGDMRPVDRALLEASVELAGLWFGLPTRIDPPEPIPADVPSRQRRLEWNGETVVQYPTWWFVRGYLPRRRTPDAVLLAAVTMADLYPDESWNYLFGEADSRARAAVFSFLRLSPEFWGGGEAPTPGTDVLVRRRVFHLNVHELGHVFGLAHCTRYRCAMNGANNLDEWDRAPLHLCPDCLRKLQWSRGFDVLERYRSLHAFFSARGLVEEAGWIARRVSRIEALSRAPAGR